MLEALRALEKQWRDTAAACRDEDFVADLGNDMMRHTAAHDHLEREAIHAFGSAVTEFSGASCTPQANVPNGELPLPR